MYLRSYDSWETKAKKLHRPRMPPMLLLPVSFIRFRKFTEDLKIISMYSEVNIKKIKTKIMAIFSTEK